MKHLITEQKFIENLLNCPKCDNISDFLNFIKDDFFGYELICDFKNIDEYKQASEINPFWELIMDKYSSIIFSPNLSTEIDEDSLYQSLGENNIFLTNTDENICKRLSEKRGYIYLSINNISDTWKQFKKSRKGFHFKVTNSNIIPSDQKFDSWAKLDGIFSPITSAIIFDRYILGDKTNQKLAQNLFPLLKQLCKHSNTLKEKLQISIITEFDNRSCINRSHQSIMDFLHACNYNNIEVNIIKHKKSLYPVGFEGLHSRFILSNYVHIKCDDSFNFFKSNGKINNDADIRIDFTMAKSHRHFFKKELLDIKAYFAKLNNNPSHPDNDMKVIFFPNLDNYLLK
jgi:hypothetical protein